MLKIRLKRVGKKHDPSFRVILTDSRKGPKSGAFLEVLGNYNAQKGEPQFNGERIKEWIGKGAQMSDTVNNLLVKAGIIQGKKKDVLHHDKIRKEREKKEAEVAPAKEAKTEEPVVAEETKPAEESAPVEKETEATPAAEPTQGEAEEKKDEAAAAPAEEVKEDETKESEENVDNNKE